MRPRFPAISLLILSAAAACASDDAPSATETSTIAAAPRGKTTLGDVARNPYFIAAREAIAQRRSVKRIDGPAKNAIIFLADGMGPTTVTAARIYDGQTRGEAGEENYLAFERMPHLALAKTYNTDAQTPDSAGTMSAIVTGVKTKIGVISVTDAAVRGECASSKDASAPTLVELAEEAGMATGVISTARLTHATPAATYAHSPDRNWERDTTLPDEAVENGCKDIASQLIDFPYGDGLEVAMGGGRSNFLPADVADPEDEGASGGRKDGRHLIAEWTAKSDAHVSIFDRKGFDALNTEDAPFVLGLFERGHMEYEADRASDAGGEPSLAEMTRFAIERLAREDKGYVLVVEAGRVDHAHHAGNAARALRDAQAFSDAVAVALDMTSPKETLVIATADHGHTLTFAGYPIKGNNILGLVRTPKGAFGGPFARAADGKPYTTLGYANGPGSVMLALKNAKRAAPTREDVAGISYRQQATIPLGSETHGGQDVPIYASGPNAYLFDGTVEQNYIFHVVDDALRLRTRASR